MTRASVAGRSSTGIAYEIAGSGEPLVLVHAGIADRRMWDSQWDLFASRHRVLRYDARGYGESLPPTGSWSQYGDLLSLLDELGIARAHLVGASMGSGIVVEAALARPDAAASLVLVAPGGALYGAPSDDLRAVWTAEVEALDRGDIDGAVEVNLRAWVDGPQRDPTAVDPAIRSAVARMQWDAFELPEWDADDALETELEPPASARLGQLAPPTLVLVGGLDQAASLEAALHLEAAVPDVRYQSWPDVGHMLTVERPSEFGSVVVDFIAATR
jgi:pimeloyl-ACP methyl ester carboxylesterase